jgi:Ca-activated chloride channel family protein
LQFVLLSNNGSYITGTEGYFGIATIKPIDTLIIYLNGNDTVKQLVDTKDFNTLIVQSDKIQASKPVKKIISFTKNYKISRDELYSDNETYSSTYENNFISAGAYPSTQVSLNYNRASYSNIRRFLNNNTTVPPDAVRIDEMLNYFSWSYEEPTGNDAFKIKSTLTGCPWNKEHQLLFLNLYTKKLDLNSLPPSHLVFLIDVSGSMDLPNRLPLLKSAFRVLINNLRIKDTVSIVVYGGITRVLLEAVSGCEKEKLTNVIDSLQPSGSTPGESGIKMAYRIAHNHYIKNGNNRVILATDGDFNVGIKSEDELEKLITEQKSSGIYLTCLGVGMGDYKDSKIQSLAQRGNGNFAYLDSYAEAEKVLFKEFFQTVYTVADNVIMTTQFNPRYVEGYRLIGYDNKISSLRDKFAAIEGGEVGSGNSLMVAFEIIPKTIAYNSDNYALIDITYADKKGNLDRYSTSIPSNYVDFSNVSDSYRLASSIIMFGMKLKKSRYSKNIKWDTIFTTARNAGYKNNYTEQEFLQLIHEARIVYKRERKIRLF